MEGNRAGSAASHPAERRQPCRWIDVLCSNVMTANATVRQGLTPAGLADFNRLVGFDHMLRPFRRERVTFALPRNSQGTGMTAEEASGAKGGVLGLAKGLVILVGLTLAAGLTSLPRTEFWKQAALSGSLQAMASAALPLLPIDVAKHVRFE